MEQVKLSFLQFLGMSSKAFQTFLNEAFEFSFKISNFKKLFLSQLPLTQLWILLKNLFNKHCFSYFINKEKWKLLISKKSYFNFGWGFEFEERILLLCFLRKWKILFYSLMSTSQIYSTNIERVMKFEFLCAISLSCKHMWCLFSSWILLLKFKKVC
jgi:hypothetical protein